MGVFNEKGVCSGFINLEQNKKAESAVLVAFSKDEHSSGSSGLSEGEKMEFRILNESINETYAVELSFDTKFPDQDKFATNGLSGINGIEITGILEDDLQENDFFIYPNPGSGIFFIDLTLLNQPFQVEVFSSMGRLLKPPIDELNGITSIDLSGRAKGIYFVKINSGKISTTKKVVLR